MRHVERVKAAGVVFTGRSGWVSRSAGRTEVHLVEGKALHVADGPGVRGAGPVSLTADKQSLEVWTDGAAREIEVVLPAGLQGRLAGGVVELLESKPGRVRLKVAASLDGRTALASGESRWISSEQSRADAQTLRARSSAILTGIAVAVLSAVIPIGEAADMTNIGTFFAFVLVCVGVIVLRYTNPDYPRPFRLPFMPIVPVLATMACLWLMWQLPGLTWIRFGVWTVIGILIYFAYGLKQSRLAALEPHAQLVYPENQP